MVKVYRDHTPRLEPYPETRAVLKTLGSEYRLGLITQGHKPGQQRKKVLKFRIAKAAKDAVMA